MLFLKKEPLSGKVVESSLLPKKPERRKVLTIQLHASIYILNPLTY